MIYGFTRSSLARLFLALAVILGLNACATETLPPVSANPVAGKTAFTRDRFGICWPGELDRSAIVDPVPRAATGEFIAGYNNHIRPGQSCNTQESFAYSGAFRFNLAGLHDRLITDARLRIDRRNTPVPVHVTRAVPSGTVVENNCQLMVEIATGDWGPGSSTGSFESTPMPGRWPLQVQQDSGIVSVGIGVQWAVQQWVLGRIPNLGFVIKPRPGDIGKNENTCTGYWSNPRLEITVAAPASH